MIPAAIARFKRWGERIRIVRRHCDRTDLPADPAVDDIGLASHIGVHWPIELHRNAEFLGRLLRTLPAGHKIRVAREFGQHAYDSLRGARRVSEQARQRYSEKTGGEAAGDGAPVKALRDCVYHDELPWRFLVVGSCARDAFTLKPCSHLAVKIVNIVVNITACLMGLRKVAFRNVCNLAERLGRAPCSPSCAAERLLCSMSKSTPDDALGSLPGGLLEVVPARPRPDGGCMERK